MIVSVYLHNGIANTLKMFGDLSDVINNVLEAMNEEHGLLDYPRCPDRCGASRYDVNITNEDYLKLYREYGPQSPRISLRRILYFFVDQEMYEQLGWEQVNEYKDKTEEYIKRRVNELENIVNKLQRFGSLADDLDGITECINSIKEKYNL